MAQYKVPQDVEADDKLLGPFSFRQFVYLLIAGVLIALAIGLFQIFPLLAIIPIPLVLLFAALALPLKKDQPMETYLAAVASYYLKPRKRMWMPGQKEVSIQITAPKIVDDTRARDITGEEATHRLSFLADIVDTEGYAIKEGNVDHANAGLVAEATTAYDMFEANNFGNITTTIQRDENQRHNEVIQEMKNEIAKSENLAMSGGIKSDRMKEGTKTDTTSNVEAKMSSSTVGQEPDFNSAVVIDPMAPVVEKPVEKTNKVETKPANPSIIELASNSDYSVATIAKEANRIKEKEKGEVFISLH
jgi:hypothetical protein